MSSAAIFNPPTVLNEPNNHYAKGSEDRKQLVAALQKAHKSFPVEVPLVIGGKEITSASIKNQVNPSAHAQVVARYSAASPDHVHKAIDAALLAKPAWETMPFAARAAVFLKAADLLSTKYRHDIVATTMLGQGKTTWQAEIDAAAELIDFLRFSVKYAQEMYATQPEHHSATVWNRVEYRALEGFVYAVTPFNFTAIAGNLVCVPALLGNVVVWKPSDSAILSNYLLYTVLLEAGLPRNVIQWVPGDPVEVSRVALAHRELAALHFTGSTAVFRQLYGQIGQGIATGRYRGYPRVVGETGGKNFHLVHPSADVDNAVMHTVRAAFEYSGQKCSAASRLYVPASLWPRFRERLVQAASALRLGPGDQYGTFVGPVIHAAAFAKLKTAIDVVSNDPQVEVLAGGTCDDAKGFFVAPTIAVAHAEASPGRDVLFKQELFGPVLGVAVYDDAGDSAGAFRRACATVDAETEYALTGAVFATDREALVEAEALLRNAAGNLYLNNKCTGAVVGQQQFGGARASGTNDKAGSAGLLSRFVSNRAVKEEFVPISSVLYPSNEE